MITVVLLSALLSLPLPLSQSLQAVDVDDLARGFGASAPQLVKAVGELEELGLPVRVELKLERADGAAAGDESVLVRWANERLLLRSDETGRVRVPLDGGRLETLRLVLPEGLRAEVGIPWIDELGLGADCSNTEVVVRAAGC